MELRTIIPKIVIKHCTSSVLLQMRKLVGYPNDFLWHIDPHRDEEGNTTTYLGLEEFLNIKIFNPSNTK